MPHLPNHQQLVWMACWGFHYSDLSLLVAAWAAAAAAVAVGASAAAAAAAAAVIAADAVVAVAVNYTAVVPAVPVPPQGSLGARVGREQIDKRYHACNAHWRRSGKSLF